MLFFSGQAPSLSVFIDVRLSVAYRRYHQQMGKCSINAEIVQVLIVPKSVTSGHLATFAGHIRARFWASSVHMDPFCGHGGLSFGRFLNQAFQQFASIRKSLYFRIEGPGIAAHPRPPRLFAIPIRSTLRSPVRGADCRAPVPASLPFAPHHLPDPTVAITC